MYRSIFSLLLLLLSLNVLAQQDSVDSEGTSAIRPDHHQLRLGLDISKPMLRAFIGNRHSLEFTADYNLPKDIYLVAEGGFGGSDIDYTDLQYTSSNTFFRLGIDKSMLQRLFPSDWDLLFVGLRYGVAFIQRSEARFQTSDPVWGSTTGTVPARSFTGHWAELTAGLRVELFRGFFAGYTVRGKFLFNQGPFRELPPAYVAGYGKGEKTTSFDFNFYLQYALRWPVKRQ